MIPRRLLLAAGALALAACGLVPEELGVSRRVYGLLFAATSFGLVVGALTNARLAGFMFLFYIVTGVANMVVFNQATSGAEGTAATLASIAQHAATMRLAAMLTLLSFFDAVVLAMALYALTRDQDPDLAVLALCCRVSEGVNYGSSMRSFMR